MALNPKIVKEGSDWWLKWDSDPAAIAYDIILGSGQHVQSGRKATTAKLGPNKPSPLPQIASARAGTYEAAIDPSAPPPPGVVLPKVGISSGGKLPFQSDDQRAWVIGQSAQLGAKIMRTDWTKGSETQKLRVLAECTAAGMGHMMILGGTKRSWNDLADFTQFSEDSARLLKTHGCEILEVCNEPDLNGASPSVYAQFAAASCAAIKRGNPDALRIIGALFDGQGGPVGYIQACIDAGADFTHVSLHLYDDPAENGDWSMWDRAYPRPGGHYNGRTVRELLDAHGLQRVPIISTESGGPTPKYSLTKQAQIVSNAIGQVKAGKIGACLIYTLADDDVPGFGLYDLQRNPRPAAAAYKIAAATV